MDRYAVIGNPIEHSKSPVIHQQFAQQTGQQLTYEKILGDTEQFGRDVSRFFQEQGKGLNVTVPFKEQAWELADERSERAEIAAAVNTLILLETGKIRGDNTDGVGLVRDLTQNHQVQLNGRRILLLGAGGASKGVALPLLQCQPSQLVIANRTATRARQLAESLKKLGPVEGCGLDELIGEFDLIINGTASSLTGEIPAIPTSALADAGVTYDMMYSSEPTAFVQWGRKNGASKALDGLGMLVEQAAESFYLWRGVRPETAPVIKSLR